MDVSNFGEIFAKNVYTSQIYHDNGDLTLQSTSGKIVVDGATAVDIGSVGSITTIKGDLAVDGSFSFGEFGNLSSDSLEGNALVIHGSSVFQGDIDLDGTISVDHSSSLNSSASTQFLVFGDQNEGSWRVGVSGDNRLNFQRHNGTSWVTLGQFGP